MIDTKSWLKMGLIIGLLISILILLIIKGALLIAIIGLLALNLVVLIHETGHFLAARRTGVDVLAFSIGMGPRLFGFKKNGTDYRISLLPVGGYVRMAGESLFEEALRTNDRSILEKPGSLFNVNNFQRIIIAAAGAVFNLISAIIFFFIAYMISFTGMNGETRVVAPISHFYPKNEISAASSGLMDGDFLLSSRDQTITNFSQLVKLIKQEKTDRLPIIVKRKNRNVYLDLHLFKTDQGRKAGICSLTSNEIGMIVDKSFAQKAGLRKNDRVLSVNEIKTPNIYGLFIDDLLKNENVHLLIDRKGTLLKIMIPKINQNIIDENKSIESGIRWNVIPKTEGGQGFKHAIKMAFTEPIMMNVRNFVGIYYTIKMPDIKMKDSLSGPLTITSTIGKAVIHDFKKGVSGGFGVFCWLTAVISSILAIMNLLPIPALDGGMILYSLAESISRKRFQPKTFYRYQFIGFFVIVTLSILILTIDFGNIFESFHQ